MPSLDPKPDSPVTYQEYLDLVKLIQTVDHRVDYFGKTLQAEIQTLRQESIQINNKLDRLAIEVTRLQQEVDQRFDKDESEDPREFRDIQQQLRDLISEVKSLRK